MKKSALLLGLVMAGLSAFAQTAVPTFISDSLDGYIRQGMKDWDVPGLAVVIVKDGQPVFKKGFGVMDLKTQRPVDDHTLFMIASNTKLFTATAISQLAHDKRLALDDKFTSYFPDFRLYDSTSTKLLTIRDLLCHRIGTKTFQGDFTFWNSRLCSAEIMKRMRLMKPEGLFRSHYGYCNSCFMAAGQVIEKTTRKSWQEYVRDSILIPLEMTETYTGIDAIGDTERLSKAYTTSFTGQLRVLPWDNWNNLAPAAAIISNVDDLAHWLTFQLDSGRYNGRQIMPFSVLRATRDINTPITSRKSEVIPTHIIGYGLGLFEADYNGYQVFWHTGGAAGMVSVVCFVPELKLGLAVLTNNDNQNLYGAIRAQILDVYTGMPYQNRSKSYLKEDTAAMHDSLNVIHGWQARVKDATPELPVSSYTGHYVNQLYGSLDIRQSVDHKHLLVKFNSHANLTATLSYMDSGDWLLEYDDIEYGIFSTRFRISGGKVVSLETKQSDEVEYDPYVFTKS